MKRLQQAGFRVTFDDEKATFQDKQTKETAFICKKGSIGMFYLRGVREGDHQDSLASFLPTYESEEWKDIMEEVDKKGANINKVKLPEPKTMSINVAHGYWTHKGKHLLHKAAKHHNITLTGYLLVCEGCGLTMLASQKAVSKTTNTKATKLC